MADWEIKKLSEVADLNPTRILKKGTVSSFIEMASLPTNARDIENITQKKFSGSGSKFKNGDTLFSRITPCLENGKTAKVTGLQENEIAHGSTEFIVISAKQPKFDEDYLYYFCRLPAFRNYAKSRMEGTSGRQRVSWQALAEFEFNFPDKEIRKKVADILKNFDDKIQLNTQTNQTLEAIAQAIFKSWFVDFDPVRAKAQAVSEGKSEREANLAAMAIISGKAVGELNENEFQRLWEIAAAFPSELVANEEFGEVPKGWGVKPFGSLLSNTIGGDWGKDEPDDKHTEQVYVFRGTDLPDVYQCNDKNVPIRFIQNSKLKNRQLQNGDIVIEVSGGSKNKPTGRSLLITDRLLLRFNLSVIPASFCRLFRPINPKLGLILGLHLQKIYSEGKTWQYQNQSTGISNFQTNVFLENEMIVLPCEIILDFFAERINPIFGKIYSNENQILAQTRDLLLPKLLSGEIEL